MEEKTVQVQQPPARERPAAPDERVRAAIAWVGQFGRTLKTCRLYDQANPTVARFREELLASLGRLLGQYGALTLHFTSDDVLLDEASLYPARSRDDNLAFAFHRDGVRALTLSPGVEPDELNALLDAVLRVTGASLSEDDLVTLLWEANLRHIEVDYVPAEGDVGTGESAAPEEGPLLPWPTSGVEEEAAAAAGTDEDAVQVEASAGAGRSDDWPTGDHVSETEATFEELEAMAVTEAGRFQREYRAEHAVPIVTSTLAITEACIEAGSNEADLAELGRFVPRILRQAVSTAAWAEARTAFRMLRRCGNQEWSVETFAQELLQPISIAGTVERLDRQGPDDVNEFIAFARELGEPAVDWLNLVLADSQERRTRRLIAEAIADVCRENPERLSPWLSDPRWFVVRNVVHILGWIGGDQILGLLQVAMRHPEPRVRHEVVAALGQVDLKRARPLLLKLLDGDSRQLSAVLGILSAERDTETARVLVTMAVDPNLETRPPEQRRAIYQALAAVGTDEIVPDLEVELSKSNWFSRSQELHRQSIAQCLARFGTPAARDVLERGAQSRRAPVRKACEDALKGGSTGETPKPGGAGETPKPGGAGETPKPGGAVEMPQAGDSDE